MISKMAARRYCILDFDETIAEVDSSQWVAEFGGVGDLYRHLLEEQRLPEHAAMNLLLRHHIPLSTISAALRRLPILPATLSALRSAASAGVDLRILSDSNSFFIDSFLRHHSISHLFAAVHTNPAWIDAGGRLRYRSLAASSSSLDFCCGSIADEDPLAPPPSMPAHSCNLCPPNLCKGDVLDAAVLRRREFDTVVYAGDGVGDLCPALRLPGSGQAVVLPRSGYPLHRHLLVLQPKDCVRAEVRPWNSLAMALAEALGLHFPSIRELLPQEEEEEEEEATMTDLQMTT